MGLVQHHTLIVSGCLKFAREKATKIFGEQFVSPIHKYPINGGEEMVIYSTGSKCGWEPYEEHKEKLEEYMAYLDKRQIEYHLVSFGELGSSINELIF